MIIFFRFIIVILLFNVVLIFNGCVSPKSRYMSKAEEGDPQAQGALGSMYLTGNGTGISYKQAYYWLRHGAANGDTVAAYYLGVMNQYGLGKVVPNQARAERHYQSVYKDIHTKARQGRIKYINILAEMYYYGRGLDKDKAKAMKMFRYCARRRWQPAVENLGVILFTDASLKNHTKAESFLIEAAAHNYPRAQFYLYECYTRRGNCKAAGEQLKRAAAGGYPPARYRLAQEYLQAGDARANQLFLKAAKGGYGPAMLVVADNTPQLDQKLVWLKKAVEHSSVPAMLQYAGILKDQVNPDPAKEMILYLLALKLRKNDPEIKKRILALDRKTALFLPIKYTWENVRGGENILLANSEIGRILSGFKAGIVESSKKLYQERLAYNPLPFFMNNDWYLIHENRLPMMWAALLFKAVEKYENENPGFWIGYGISAGLAGQGTAQAFAAFKLNEIIKKRRTSDNKTLMNIAALLKANALMLMNYEKEAYNSLFENGSLHKVEQPYLINFVNAWCQPLLKDKRKFSAATGIKTEKLGKYAPPDKQKFLNLEYGRVIFVKPEIKEPRIDYSNFKKKK